MYRIAVCDDEKDSLQQAESMAGQILQGLHADFMIDSYLDTTALYCAIQQGVKYHLLILDILFNGPEGLKLARELRALGEDCCIIVISKCADYVWDGYDIHAIKYLLKPLEREQMKKAIVYAYCHEYQGEDKLTLECGSERVVIYQKEILYIESMRHTLLFHLFEGKKIQWGGSLSEIEEQLTVGKFVRCHKSYIINLEQVQSIRRYTAVLFKTNSVPIGRKYFGVSQREFMKLHMVNA